MATPMATVAVMALMMAAGPLGCLGAAVNETLVAAHGVCSLTLDCPLPRPRWFVADAENGSRLDVRSDFWTRIEFDGRRLYLPLGPLYRVYGCRAEEGEAEALAHLRNRCGGWPFLGVCLAAAVIVLTLIATVGTLVGLCIRRTGSYESF